MQSLRIKSTITMAIMVFSLVGVYTISGKACAPSLDKYLSTVFEGGQGQSKLDANQEFSVLVWNLYKEDKNNFFNDFNSLIEKTDIGIFQEYLWNNEMSSTVSKIGENGRWWGAVESFKSSGFATGVMSISRFQPERIIGDRSKVTEPFFGTPKTYLAAWYPISNSNKKLLVVNNHAINFVLLNTFKSYITEVRAIIEKHQGPVIWAGDFNTWNEGRKEYLNETANELGLVKVDISNENRSIPLDHIYVRDVKVIRADLLSEIESSDHTPILMRSLIETSTP